MALEALLPSEIARLVYGYLIHERCMETANTFLNESPNLEECRNVLSYGRHFTTRVCGYALMDILEKFCMLNSIIQEKINKINNVNKIKQCGDLIGQIKFLLEEYRGVTSLNINALSENSTSIVTESPPKCRKKRLNYNKIENKSKIEQISNNEFETQNQTNVDPIENSDEVETTLLKNLPGYINNSPNGKCEKDKLKSVKKLKDIIKIDVLRTEADSKNKSKEQIKDRTVLNQQCSEIKEINEFNFSQETLKEQINCEVQTSEIELCNEQVDKNIMTDSLVDISKNCMNIEVQTSDIGSSDSQVSSPHDCVELLNELTFELLNRTELQEKIAENINKVLEPIKSNFQEKSMDKLKNDNIQFITNFNKMVETVVHTTETDPEIVQLLNEIVQPNEENLKTEDKMEVDINSSESNCPRKNNFSFGNKDFKSNDNTKSIELQKCYQNESNNVEINDNNKFTSPEPMTSKKINTSKEIVQNSTCNAKNNKLESNSSISPNSEQKSTYKSDSYFTLNNTLTSTPIKTFMAVQSFDTCDWFSTQDLPIPNIVCPKENNNPSSKIDYPFTYTASEAIEATSSCLSPIVFKDGHKVVGKPKDQMLHTPDIIYQSKNSLPDNSTTTVNSLSKNKTPVLHKTSEILEELLNLNTSQKSNLNVDNLPTPFKDSNDYNKLFSVDSIMLYGIDSNINSVRTPLTVPEIEVDTITLSSGFSPFLKVQKSCDGFSSHNKRNEEEIVKNVTNEQSYEPLTSVKLSSKMSATKISEFITKNTPTKLLESRSKNNRLSLSTPKKPNNYIRALDFEMLSSRSQSESKLNDKTFLHSPEILKKNNKSSYISSLFQSPPITNTNVIDQNLSNRSPDKVNQNESVSNFIPIMKEKQKNKTKNLNEKASNDEDKITDKPASSKQNKTDLELVTLEKVNIKKGSWDSDLRKYLGSDNMDNKLESSIKNEKKNIKEKQKASSKEHKKDKLSSTKARKNKDEVKPKKLKKIEVKEIKSEIEIQKENDVKALRDSLEIISDSVNEVDKSNNSIRTISPKINNLETFDETKSINEISRKYKDKEVEKIKLNDSSISEILETIKKVPNKNLDKKELKSENLKEMVEENAVRNESTINFEKIESDLNKLMNTDSHKPNLQKTEVIYDHISKVESGKLVQKKYARLKTLDTNLTQDQKCLPLSEFAIEMETPRKEERQVPPTPQFLSPASSSLMMPNSKLSEDSRTIQSLITMPFECPPTPKIVVTPAKESTVNATEKCDTTGYYPSKLTAFDNVKKSEITQFEVIKDNLFKDKKLDIQSKIEFHKDCAPKLDTALMHRGSTVITESEDSNSSSSCSRTTCSGTCSLSDKESTAHESILENLHNKDVNVEEKDVINIKSKNEASPVKVFTINKTEKEIEKDIKETPVKDEHSCIEAGIFETPNIVKPCENPTNLNTKISQMMVLKEQDEMKNQQSKLKPKIISVEYVLPKIITKPPTQLLKALPLNIQLKALEVKNESNRLAMIEKLKNGKSELEVAKAVESITNNEELKFNESLDLDDKSIESSVSSLIIKNDDKYEANKMELVKAIESITKLDNDIQNHSSDSIHLLDENSSNENLQLVLEEEDVTPNINKKQNVQNSIKHDKNIEMIETLEISLDKDMKVNESLGSDTKFDQSIGHTHNTRFQSRQKIADEKNQSINPSLDFGSCSALCQEMSFVFDEENYKRKRRKAFTDGEMTTLVKSELGESIEVHGPTPLDILFVLKPPRKKRVKKVPVLNKKYDVEDEDSSEDSWEANINNNDDKETNIITKKRRRTSGVTENISHKKRKKQSIFIY